MAADPLMNSAITGASGGLIIAVADDPSMHSSQNEQDSRYYGNFAMIPVLEPGNQQECYDMAFYGFELSEKYHIPVLLRLPTRLAHSRSGIVTKEPIPQNEMRKPEDMFQFMLLPAIARKKYQHHLELQKDFMRESLNSPFNAYKTEASSKKLGIITTGLAYNYLREAFKGEEIPYPVLKIVSILYLKNKFINSMIAAITSIIEEGMPVWKNNLKACFSWSKTNSRTFGWLPSSYW